jgi:hypothetical protein
MVEETDLLKVLLKTNSSSLQPIKQEVLQNILNLVIMYPLNEDRDKCQEEIKKIVSQPPKGCITE